MTISLCERDINMVLVDTSVLIGYLKGQTDNKTELLKDVLIRETPFGISSYTYQEILQGARNEKEFETLKEYLSTQKIYFLKQEISTFEKASRMFFDLRRKGSTPRSTIDILIALTAIEYNLILLHNDNDFDNISKHIPDLKIMTRTAY